MPSPLHETFLQGTMVTIINIAKQGAAFVTMFPVIAPHKRSLHYYANNYFLLTVLRNPKE